MQLFLWLNSFHISQKKLKDRRNSLKNSYYWRNVSFSCIWIKMLLSNGVLYWRRNWKINLANALGSRILDKKKKKRRKEIFFLFFSLLTWMDIIESFQYYFLPSFTLPPHSHFSMDIENSNFCLKLKSNISLWCIEKLFQHISHFLNGENFRFQLFENEKVWNLSTRRLIWNSEIAIFFFYIDSNFLMWKVCKKNLHDF